MLRPSKYLLKNVIPALIIMVVMAFQISAQGLDDVYPVQITYQELGGSNQGYADVTLSLTLPMGTPLLARETAIGSALSALHDLWAIESVHEEVRGFLGPVVPMDVQYIASMVSGDEFIILLMDAFETVADAGFSRFQGDQLIRSTERIMTSRDMNVVDYPDPPRYFAWLIGEGLQDDEVGYENWVIASLINYSASILSFRSEFGRFPDSLAELRERNHLLIQPLNPYTGEPVRETDSASPGDLTYEPVDSDRVVLFTYIMNGMEVDPVRREINVSSAGAYNLLYRQTAGLSDTDKHTARYVFQISIILNEYYFEKLDLPYRIPQCEAEGFAYVSFINPYTNLDAAQADSLSTIRAGDYTYNRISSSAYFLVGYGSSGVPILSVSKDFGASTQLQMGTMSTE